MPRSSILLNQNRVGDSSFLKKLPTSLFLENLVISLDLLSVVCVRATNNMQRIYKDFTSYNLQIQQSQLM